MSWFEDIKENTLVKVKLKDRKKKIKIYFIKVSNGIVKGKLKKNGQIEKFKEEQILSLRVIGLNNRIYQKAEISTNSQKIINNIIEKKQQNEVIQHTNNYSIPSIKTSFLNKIDNLILSPIEFNGKDTLLTLKQENIFLYSRIMGIFNQFENAKRINELDFKFSRSQRIIKQLNTLLKENYYEEIDIFLAYVLQEVDISYFEFFKKNSEYIYCLKHDIYFFNIKNNKYGFIVAEQLFELYDLDYDIEDEWIYLIKNMPTFNSFKTLQYQYDFRSKLSKSYQDLFDESINYIFNKFQLENKPNLINEQIKFLEENFKITSEYKNLNSINSKIKDVTSSKNNINFDLNYNDFSSFGDSLYKIVQPNFEKELEKVLQPNGTITTFFKDRNYGFIESVKGITHHFAIQNIIDDNLLKKIQEKNNPNKNIEVCFSTSYNYKGEIAEAIQKPKKINKILDEVSKYKNNGHYNIAQKLLEQILSQYPNNLKVKKIYADLINSKPKQYSNYNKYKNYVGYGNYRKAKDAQLKKDYDTAIKYFKIAIENNEKVESAIKDLTLAYYESGDIENSKNFLLENENKLPKISTTYNFLENHYSALGLYEKSIEYVNLLLEETENLNKEVILLAKKATCYVKLNNKVEAKKILEDILMLQKDNSYARKLLEEIKTGNLSTIDIDISSFGGGLSKFMEDTLTNYEEYSGITPTEKEAKKFTKGTLKKLQDIIKNAGRARPKERASYLLTEAKLLQELEPDNEIYLKAILKRYCIDMSANHIADYSPLEVIRFFLIEASILEIEWEYLLSQIVVPYFNTYFLNHNELINTKLSTIDESALDKVLTKVIIDNNNRIWNNILDMFIWNETITKHLSKKFFNNNKFKRLSLNFFNTLNLKTNGSNNFDNYIDTWNQAREKRRREYQQWFNLIKSIIQINNLEQLVNQINKNLKEFEKIWLTTIDGRVLNTISEINKRLEDYLIQKTFDDKERTKTYILTEINELLNDIKRLPTKFSYEGYKPLLEKIEKLLNQSFLNILKTSTPQIDIKLLGDSVVVDKNSISLQLSIINSKESSPISNAKIEIMKTDDIEFVGGETQIYESIRGGDEKIVKFDIKVSNNVIDDLATDIGIILKYNIRAIDEPTEKKFQIPIRLYTSDKFEKIKNVYAPLAEGGAVRDKKMFFGRDEYINNIVNFLITINSKNIIIYGQKRSGKTSVLYHLKKSLEDKENAFCISFSMGEIIANLSSTTLFNKILESIEDELENLEEDGYEIPKLNRPNISELEKYPESIFNETLKRFIKSMKKLSSWKNKKLVILIDEFTYVYTSIKKGELNSNFMKSWKAFIEKNYFSAVLIGQDVAPKFKQEFSNEFGVTEDKRLTYLSEYDAKELIEKPIWDKERDSSRYIGKAIDRVIDYTACSPYYLQMFCARVVDYMNRKKAISITEADIEEIANSFTEGTESLSEDKFDNLFTAGDADVESFNLSDVKNVLIKIAKKTDIGTCSKDDIVIDDLEQETIEEILKDLEIREVVEVKKGFYKIKVELFKKWLLKQ